MIKYSYKEKLAYDKGYRINNTGEIISPRNKKLKPYYISIYKNFNFRYNGKSYNCKVHRLQAYQKYKDEIYKNNIVVRHLDGNPNNNHRDNIEIGSYSDNMFDVQQEIRINRSSKANLKYNHENIIKDYNLGMTYLEIMDKYGISSKGTVSFIINKSLKKY